MYPKCVNLTKSYFSSQVVELQRSEAEWRNAYFEAQETIAALKAKYEPQNQAEIAIEIEPSANLGRNALNEPIALDEQNAPVEQSALDEPIGLNEPSAQPPSPSLSFKSFDSYHSQASHDSFEIDE